MSHFTRIKTQIVEKKYLPRALQDLNYAYEEGDVEIRGYGGNRIAVEIKIPTSNRGYDIGFRKSGDAYELVADWYGTYPAVAQSEPTGPTAGVFRVSREGSCIPRRQP